jgi:hypothetical protein
MLDSAKCYHILDQLSESDDHYNEKMNLINNLLISEQKPELWIYFSMFTRNEAT